MAALAALAVFAITAVITALVDAGHDANIRAAVTARADTLARDMSDIVARESAAVETLAAFVELSHYEPDRLREDFPIFAEALMDQGPHIRSVQLAPNSILEYVYPLSGNEAALNLDLMADPERRALLERATVSGETTIQGPVQLVQGGNGLIVRRPTYAPDGTFWGFTAIALDWDLMAEKGRFFDREGLLVGLRRSGSDTVLDGDSGAFESGSVIRNLHVGATDTQWEIGVVPTGGWVDPQPAAWVLWAAGALVAAGSAALAFIIAREPQVLRSERQRAIEERRIVEARYEAAFEHAAVGIAIAERDGSIVQSNAAFRRIVEADEAEVVAHRLVDFIHPDHRESHGRRMGGLRASGESFEHETRFGGERSHRWGRMRVAAAPGVDGERAVFVAVVEDTTERRRWEIALAASEERFRTLFESAPVAIQREDYSGALAFAAELAPDSESLRRHLEQHPENLAELLSMVPITDANPTARSLQQHLGRFSCPTTLGDRLTAPAIPTYIDTIVALSEGEETAELAVTTVGADGEPMYLVLQWRVPVVNGALDHSAVLVSMSDVTRLRRTEQQLEELLASKDRFLASVAHELRTPLTAVVGFAQEMVHDREQLSPEDQREFTELIAYHGAEMAHLIEDLLVLARVDIGEVRVEPARIDLVDVVDETLRTLPGLAIEVSTPDGSVPAFADAARVRQIVRNLGTNAVRYGGDEIGVAVRRRERHAILEVSDNGPELDPKEARRIFEPYERRHHSASQPGSIGLGLTVSRSLARLHGGDLVLVREDDRNVFRASFPLFSEPASISVA
jgi:PAS domain S-box-containing protein